MRDKGFRSRRRAMRSRPQRAQPGAAGWLLENEAGRGFPNGYFAMLAGLVVATKAVPWIVGKVVSWRARRSRQPGA